MEHYRLINEEYKVWKKNCPFLYDLVSVHALEWPSLTCEWLPGRDTSSSSFGSTQKLLLGTHTTSGHQNYLLVVQVDLPLSPAECHGENQEARNGMQGIPSKLSLTQRINHDGEVNCARHMPQDPNVIATCTPSGQIHIFDIAKHPTTPAQQNTQARPQLKLKGHKREGYSLSFNLRKSGMLATGADDNLVHIWDFQGAFEKGSTELDPLRTFTGHTERVNDVAWNPVHEVMLASVSDDKTLKVWDTRVRRDRAASSTLAHNKCVTCLAFNTLAHNIMATGSEDRTVGLWDARQLKKKLHTFVAHDDEVLRVHWSSTKETLLASGGGDRRVCLWDMAKINSKQSPEDAQDGPPELIFVHAGHTAKVMDVCWNPNFGDEWLLASVAEDNIMQLWRVTESIFADMGSAPSSPTAS